MNKQFLRWHLGLVVALVLIGASVFGPSANATQPECQVVNLPPKKTVYTSNEYANPLATAIADAGAGDTLQVIGSCHGSFQITKDLSLMGRASADHHDTLDGDSVGAVVYIPSGVTGVDLKVSDLTITDGMGGIYAYSGDVTVTNVEVTGNARTGIANYQSARFAIENSLVSDNHAAGAGSAGFGGGVYNSLATMTISNSTVEGNTATGLGGGIFTRGNLSISNSTIEGNSAGQEGGGVYVSSAATITDSIVTRNTAAVAGGGIRGNATLVGTNYVCGNTPDDWPGCSP